MATKTELAERLLTRFKGVPNFTISDAEELISDAMQVHGFAPDSDVPTDSINVVLLYAQAEGAQQIALGSAHYFSYTDGEEGVDKTKVFDNYMKLAQYIRGQYDAENARKSGVKISYMKRVDRP